MESKIIPAYETIHWTELRRTAGTRKGGVGYHLIEDANGINVGIALNEKLAGLSFPDITGKLDYFNSDFRSSNLYSASGVKISLHYIGTRKEKEYKYGEM